MKDEIKNENVEVSREAIATLAAQAAGGVEGVTVCQAKAVDSLTSRMKREFVHKGIKVEKGDEGSYKLSVYLRVEYGLSIPALAQEVRNKIKEYVEGLTEVELVDVDVVIEDIDVPA
jgi:uncharacterized alkaline shock family protein YloU